MRRLPRRRPRPPRSPPRPPPKKAPAKKAAPAQEGRAKKAAAKKPAPAKKAAPPKKVAAKKAAPPAKKAAPAKPAPPPKPVKKVTPYDAKFLDAQREMLLEERARYTRQADRLASEAAALVEDLEPGDVQFDEESGEGDTIVVERERDLAMSAQALQAVAEIDAALERIDDKHLRLVDRVGAADPQGASARHPVGVRASGGEGGRTGHHLTVT